MDIPVGVTKTGGGKGIERRPGEEEEGVSMGEGGVRGEVLIAGAMIAGENKML
jgi:hypothetical protein